MYFPYFSFCERMVLRIKTMIAILLCLVLYAQSLDSSIDEDLDYYEILGISVEDNAKTIKKAYRKLSVRKCSISITGKL